MLDHDMADTERFEELIQRSVRQILLAPDPDSFLDWARGHLPELLGLSGAEFDEVERRRLANLLGTAIWNATPQPAYAFQTRLMTPHPPEEPCSCGSGSPYGECCGALNEVPELSSDLVWEILLDELSEQGLREALDLHAVPEPLLARIADRWLTEDRPKRAAALLEPLFAGSLEDLDGEFEPSIDILCDAYDRLGHRRKKEAFLERICDEASRSLRAAAWQRRCTMAIDNGDFAEAGAAFTAALRSDPDNPGTAILEITLLAAQHKDWIARERARFWLFRFRQIGFTHPGILDFLARAVEDPQEALVDSHSDALDPVLLDLLDWISLIEARPMPAYCLEPLNTYAPGWLPGQLALFDDLDAPMPDGADDDAVLGLSRYAPSPARLSAPPAVRRLETQWRSVFPTAKPDSTRLVPAEDVDLWATPDWLDHLLANPALADSLDVLDDLATALYLHPESTLPWISHLLLRPLLERARGILEQVLPEDAPQHIPWSAPPNRPALRLLFRQYLCQIDEDEPNGAARTLETLLRLNPRDNHGVRAELMNYYLRDGQDELALALARRFPNDGLADLAYGEVLALYRLGRQDRARLVLTTAVNRLPRIPQYLTRKRIKRPRFAPPDTLPGGDDQAWMYREAMRDVWAAEPGILAWLRRLTA
ncbi:SEC-C domain-containing protein [Thiocapsa bogorovii]|uniref:SEC-C domain-containing protein n=1 Tax=Thiocapsa bogorovii TaxID=521689 RepID=UPI001E3C0B6A|nr:SEC-C domain-containing protein [Thiocapsa bogorovii]UHD18751.1 SEC-C domain-containing protein [Thiocapsa bogorovii]